MDHDRLFKQLLRTFFAEFLELLLPEVSAYIEPGSVEFLDKEVFTDLTAGDRHEVDLLVKCRFREASAGETFFLVHVETQASAQGDFAARMFRYFARLTERHALPVYPIALFTYDAPSRPENDVFEVGFPDLTVLAFRFRAIQLNRMDWRAFVRRPNPVAAALMTRMKIAPEDRPRVKLECLRLLTTLRPDRARQALIRDFMDAYLRLNAVEIPDYNAAVFALEPSERKAVMETLNEWELIGEERGMRRGLAKAALQFLTRHVGELPLPMQERINDLSEGALNRLIDSVDQLKSVGEVESWLTTNT